MRIVAVGSVNMDVVNRVARHPQPGETVHGLGTEYSPGGKGANQAVAAARAGAAVAMVAAVGSDSFGQELRDSLGASGIDAGRVLTKPGTSGLAFITVDQAGENIIILSQGANGKLSPEDVDAAGDVFDGAAILLTQNEIPWKTTRFALESAHRRGVRTLFNPAPAFAAPKDVLPYVDWMVLNETEAEHITGVRVDGPDAARRAASLLVADGVGAAVVTLGEQGAVYLDRSGQDVFTPAYRVDPVDTTAAGDTFIGAFAARIAAGSDVRGALRFASAAAALTVTRRGAQSSIPRRAEIEAFLQAHP